MRKPTAVAHLILLACYTAFSQNAAPTPAPSPEFEVATVKPAHPEGFAYSMGVQFDPGMVRMAGFSMADYINMAYKLGPLQLSGPDWMKTARYDVTAKMPAGKQEQFPAMLQKLLEQRFQLKFHHETRVLPVYALVVSGSGLKIHPAESTEGANAQWEPGHVEAHGTSLAGLAAGLRAMDRPVVDQTGVTAVFDFTLDWAEDEEHEAAGIPSIRAVLEDKLGLKLEPRKLPVEMLVIDRLEKKPTEN